MVFLLALVLVFHCLVAIQVIPYTIVWAGKLSSVDEMRKFELVSIAINLFLLFVLLAKGNLIRHRIHAKWINGILWVFVALFALNTVGNLFAKSAIELYLFTGLTFISGVLCGRIVTAPASTWQK